MICLHGVTLCFLTTVQSRMYAQEQLTNAKMHSIVLVCLVVIIWWGFLFVLSYFVVFEKQRKNMELGGRDVGENLGGFEDDKEYNQSENLKNYIKR